MRNDGDKDGPGIKVAEKFERVKQGLLALK
jgi:hypothetical protein